MSEAATTVTVTVTTAVTTSVEVKPTLESLIRVIPFSVSIPAGIDFLDAATATATATVQVPSNDNERSSSTSSTGSTVVGTITLMGSSIMIWMSWDFASANNSKNNRNAPPQMGPLCIAAPAPSFQRQRQRQRGKSSSSPSSSQLIGSHSDEDQMLALQMSTRMTKLVEKPVLISSSLYSMAEHTIEQQMGGMAISSSDGINNNQGGITAAPLVMRASALAERKVKSILLELKEGNKL